MAQSLGGWLLVAPPPLGAPFMHLFLGLVAHELLPGILGASVVGPVWFGPVLGCVGFCAGFGRPFVVGVRYPRLNRSARRYESAPRR